MTTHEMILLCSSLQGVGRCILLCLVLGFATFSASAWLPPTYGLKHAAACRSMLQHSKFFLGTVGACPCMFLLSWVGVLRQFFHLGTACTYPPLE